MTDADYAEMNDAWARAHGELPPLSDRAMVKRSACAAFLRRAERVIGQWVEDRRGARPGDLDDDGMVNMRRAGGGAPCEHCGALLYDHPHASAFPAPADLGGGHWLTRDCLGRLWHL